MVPVENPDVGFPSGIVPELAQYDDRGDIWFDADTTSSTKKSTSYCKDVIGCGNFEYRQVGGVVTLNRLDGCTPRLNGVLSISGLFYNQATVPQLDDMIKIIRIAGTGSGGFDEQASLTCPIVV